MIKLLSEFHPDWAMLDATRDALKEQQDENKRLREALGEIRAHHQCHDCEYYQKSTAANCCDATVMMVNKALAANDG